ncbi:MAG TPA: tetratricopeptide repeat protein [Alphaproteobacteria bacterium]|jgi:predicted TPR repeat methyltransferase|nr:tetratricopeptide repeat protein [Alphaproteobacteria bacterium]
MDNLQRRANEPHVRGLMSSAIALHRDGRLAEAEAKYRSALEMVPGHFDALHNLAVLCLQRNDPVGALDFLRRASAINPASATLHLNIGNAFRAAGDNRQALDSYDRALRLNPDFAEAHNNRATVLRTLGREDEAIASADRAVALNPRYREAHLNRAHALDTGKRYEEAIVSYRNAASCGADPEEVAYYLAALGAAPLPAASPRSYVAGLFDGYAENFDQSLLGLGYDVPRQLAAAVVALRPNGVSDVADVGCGTGLSGAALRAISSRLVGADLSAKMLAKAQQRGVYDRLAQAELVEFLRVSPQSWDLIVAADVLIYMGDLEPVFAAARSALHSTGLFAYSVEAHDTQSQEGDGYVIRPTRRFAHSLDYLRGVAARHGFTERSVLPMTVRSEAGRGIPGYVVVVETSGA